MFSWSWCFIPTKIRIFQYFWKMAHLLNWYVCLINNSIISQTKMKDTRIGYFTTGSNIKFLLGYFTEFVNSVFSRQYQFVFLPPSHLEYKVKRFRLDFRNAFDRGNGQTIKLFVSFESTFFFKWKKTCWTKLNLLLGQGIYIFSKCVDNPIKAL